MSCSLEHLGYKALSTFSNLHIFIRYWNDPKSRRYYPKMEKNHPRFFLDVHDFSLPPPDPVEPPKAQLGAGDFGEVEKKRSQLFADARVMKDNYTTGQNLKNFCLP